MANYIKEYEVLGRRYGIEDFQSPGKHFFGGKSTDGKPLHRFMLWSGGCSVGNYKTLDEAYAKLEKHISSEVSRQLQAAESKVQECNAVLGTLDAYKTNLAPFNITRKPK